MSFHERDTVVLERDLPEHELRRGDIGSVVHIYAPDTVEVEFVRASGRTQAVVRLPTSAVRATKDEDVPAVRTGSEHRRGAA
jgi:hypothetical protein